MIEPNLARLFSVVVQHLRRERRIPIGVSV
jgi:hypothetical protein